MYQYTLGELICKGKNIDPLKGQKSGTCGACGRERKDLLLSNYRKTFTSSEYLHESDYICPFCSELYENSEYRYSNWLCDQERYKKLKKNQVLQALYEQERFPFALYTTATYQKQGWIRMITQGITYSKGMLSIGYDMNLIQGSIEQITRFVQIARFFRGKKIYKTAMATGIIPFNLFLTLDETIKRNFLRFIKQNGTNIVWKWILDFLPKEEDCESLPVIFEEQEILKLF